MKLIEALNIISKTPGDGTPMNVALICGFTPLHLSAFLHAELNKCFPDNKIILSTGLYGDLLGNLNAINENKPDAAVVLIEWADLDARLGTRQLGGWGPRHLKSICDRVSSYLAEVGRRLDQASANCPIYLCLPTLPLPPLFHTYRWQASNPEMQLRGELFSFASRFSNNSRINLLNIQRLDHLSPPSERLDVKSEWESGFPFSIPHASVVGELLAKLIHNPPGMKGLITDLDNTLWNGIVGDVGAQGVHWDLDHHSQSHGIYQQFLRTLSEEGALLGIASKNDPANVEEVFQRADILLPKNCLFPCELGWQSKSRSIGRILKIWNIGADSVVFIDDSLAEIAEVRSAYPDIKCIQFPCGDHRGAYKLIEHLRDLFGRRSISQEDALRLNSIREHARFEQDGQNDENGFSEELLREMKAELTLSFVKDERDGRLLDLLNKTNQFNLNGKRYTESSWQDYMHRPDTYVLAVSYKDRFGLLGKIAVLAGRTDGNSLWVDTWAMSCRAFARRIEHQCVKSLFDFFGAAQILLNYTKTTKNIPLARFLKEIIHKEPEGLLTLSRESFLNSCPKLYHQLVIPRNADLTHV